jgi:hypothetical protein
MNKKQKEALKAMGLTQAQVDEIESLETSQEDAQYEQEHADRVATEYDRIYGNPDQDDWEFDCDRLGRTVCLNADGEPLWWE